MLLFDGFARLADPEFTPAELPEIVDRARKAKIGGAIIAGTSLEASRRAIQIAERFAGDWEPWAAIGVSPAAAGSINEETITALHRMGQARRVRAVSGGLDLSPRLPPRRVQEEALGALFQIAGWLDLPVVLRASAGSGPRLIDWLQSSPECHRVALIHDFNDSADLLEAYLALGLSISVSGRVTDRREGAPVRSTLPDIPLDRLLIETSAPDHPPKPHHLKTSRSEPSFLPDVLKEVAHLRHTRAEPLGEAVTGNARRLLHLDL